MKNIKEINKESKDLLRRIKNGEDKEGLIEEFETFINDVANVLGDHNPFVELLKDKLNKYKERLTKIKEINNDVFSELNTALSYRQNAGLSL